MNESNVLYNLLMVNIYESNKEVIDDIEYQLTQAVSRCDDRINWTTPLGIITRYLEYKGYRVDIARDLYGFQQGVRIIITNI